MKMSVIEAKKAEAMEALAAAAAGQNAILERIEAKLDELLDGKSGKAKEKPNKTAEVVAQ
jgi:hypothetical protein